MSLCNTISQPIAVIAPVVPTLFSVLGPVILIAAGTLILAVPRWFLTFAYWLWLRTVPSALRDRKTPGVLSRPFEGVAARQFTDEYTFSIADKADLPDRIRAFFHGRGAADEAQGPPLTFSRGRRFFTYFLPHIIPWREQDFLQRIIVRTTPASNGQVSIHLRYVVRTFCMLRVQPAGLQTEAGELFGELNLAP